MKAVYAIAFASVAVFSLFGCASKSSVESAQATANSALTVANDAMALAQENSEKMDRMYQRIMSK